MNTKYSAPAVSKLLDIVELMSRERRGFSINELAKLLNNPINTVYRICMEMEERGYLEKDTRDGLYYLGGRFYTVGQIAGSRMDLRTKALPAMEDLRDRLGETVHLTVLRDGWMILLEQLETAQPIRIHVDTGSLLYPHASAFGKCLLAYCERSFIDSYAADRMISLTNGTITEPQRFREELEKTLHEGWAEDNEEYMAGVVCVGAPVHRTGSLGIAAVGVMAPSYRFNRERMEQAVPLVRKAAGDISACMGHV